jgi:hypothetical protein
VTLPQQLVVGQAWPQDLPFQTLTHGLHHKSMYNRAGQSRELSSAGTSSRSRGRHRRFASVRLQVLSDEVLDWIKTWPMKARRMAWMKTETAWTHHPQLTKTCRPFVTAMFGNSQAAQVLGRPDYKPHHQCFARRQLGNSVTTFSLVHPNMRPMFRTIVN